MSDTEPGPPLPSFSFWSRTGALFVYDHEAQDARSARPGELVQCGYPPDVEVRQVNATADGWVR